MSEILTEKISSKDYTNFFEQLAKSTYPKLYERLVRYDEIDSFKLLKQKGMFCGMDYVGIEKLRPANFFSRDDHSRNCAYMALYFTGNYRLALAARFHDVGTYPFAHIRSYKEGNESKQDKDEMSVYTVVSRDKKAMSLLAEDKVDLAKICDVSRYPIIDKERPSLCIDRLDGILSACYIWTKEFDLDIIKKLFSLVTVCYEKVNGNHLISDSSRKNYIAEICLRDYWDSIVNVADFMEAINSYSTWQISKESRYATAFLGEILQLMDEQGVIPNDYFNLTEGEMIQLFLASPYSFLWRDFINLHSVRKAMDSDINDYTLNPKTKIRYAEPLIMIPDYFSFRNGIYPSDDIAYEEYIKIEEAVEENKGPLYAEISEESKKILLKSKNKQYKVKL